MVRIPDSEITNGISQQRVVLRTDMTNEVADGLMESGEVTIGATRCYLDWKRQRGKETKKVVSNACASWRHGKIGYLLCIGRWSRQD